MGELKKCTKCGEIKELKEFTKSLKWCKECQKEYREEHKEYYKKYREDHRDYFKAKSKERYNNNKEYYRDYFKSIKGITSRFNAQVKYKANIESKISEEEVKEMLEFFDYKCAYSGVDLNENNLSFDHIQPLSKGGVHKLYNIVPCDKSINSSKNDSSLLYWWLKKDYYNQKRVNNLIQYYAFYFLKNRKNA